MNPFAAWLLGEGIDVGAEKTGLKDRARGILGELADAIVPPAAASDASAIPQQDLIPADVVMTPAQEQQVMQNADIYNGFPYRENGEPVGANAMLPESGRQPQVTQMQPTQLPDMQMSKTADDVQQFVKDASEGTLKLLQEVPEEVRADPETQKAAAATSMVYNLGAKGAMTDKEPMDLGAPVFGPSDVAKGMYPDGKPQDKEPDFFEKTGGFLSDIFGDEETMTRLALAFNSMRYQPDQGLATVLGKRLETLGTSRKANATARALRAKGTPAAIAAADYIEQTGDAKGGLKMAMEADQYVTGSGKEIAEQYGITGLIPNKPYRYNKLTKKVEGVGGGDTIFEATKPSKGYEFVRDESGKILYEQPIPKKITPERAGTKIQSAELVLDDMNRLTNLIEESPKLTTGFGTMLSGVPTTAARDAQALAGTIKANIGFDRLQRMREESPTGGALGQVAVQELQALQSTLGSLDLGQSTEQVLYNVNRLKKQYAKTMLALAESQPNFSEYFPEFNRSAYEKILSEKDGQEPLVKPQITPEQAAAELARRRGK